MRLIINAFILEQQITYGNIGVLNIQSLGRKQVQFRNICKLIKITSHFVLKINSLTHLSARLANSPERHCHLVVLTLIRIELYQIKVPCLPHSQDNFFPYWKFLFSN
ncbi:hypothetical protein FGO68_gene17346 [Halteria grandinella]|uniref:Uncharacterized protein n=1 Tax=Halteria grandinella TaxID=5974 RepID=A0A8J8P464_HALGN|nr:hypothetical protein FGO68_gene17346 [Halteria grandinella]